MQRLAAQAAYDLAEFMGEEFFPSRRVSAINRIPDDRVSLMRQMHADLMSASRFQPAAYEADSRTQWISKALQGLIIGDGLLAPIGPDSHFLPV